MRQVWDTIERRGATVRRDGLSLRVAETAEDMAAVLALRARCFGAAEADRHDATADHLLVSRGRAVLGALRLLTHDSPASVLSGYAAEVYDLDSLARIGGAKLEIGRLCLADAAPKAHVLRLIWGAVASRALRSGARMLFGCTSLAGCAPERHGAALATLAAAHVAPRRWRPGAKAVEVIGLSGHGTRGVMPPLLRGYLALGAAVSDHVVVDRGLGTLHVFTGLETAAVPPGRARVLRQLAATAGAV